MQLMFDMKSPTLIVAVRQSGTIVVFDTKFPSGRKGTVCAAIGVYAVSPIPSSLSASTSSSSSSSYSSRPQQVVGADIDIDIDIDVDVESQQQNGDHLSKTGVGLMKGQGLTLETHLDYREFSKIPPYFPSDATPNLSPNTEIFIRPLSRGILGYLAVSTGCKLSLFNATSTFIQQRKGRRTAESSSSLTMVNIALPCSLVRKQNFSA